MPVLSPLRSFSGPLLWGRARAFSGTSVLHDGGLAIIQPAMAGSLLMPDEPAQEVNPHARRDRLFGPTYVDISAASRCG